MGILRLFCRYLTGIHGKISSAIVGVRARVRANVRVRVTVRAIAGVRVRAITKTEGNAFH